VNDRQCYRKILCVVRWDEPTDLGVAAFHRSLKNHPLGCYFKPTGFVILSGPLFAATGTFFSILSDDQMLNRDVQILNVTQGECGERPRPDLADKKGELLKKGMLFLNVFRRGRGRGLDTDVLRVHQRCSCVLMRTAFRVERLLPGLSGDAPALQFTFANACHLLVVFGSEPGGLAVQAPCQLTRSRLPRRHFVSIAAVMQCAGICGFKVFNVQILMKTVRFVDGSKPRCGEPLGLRLTSERPDVFSVWVPICCPMLIIAQNFV
jgi:hypothetical protein